MASRLSFLSVPLLALGLCAAIPVMAAEAPVVPAAVENTAVGAASAPAEAHAEGTAEAGAAHEAGEGGLPQFDTTKFPGQLFWLIISFALTYALMRFVAVPKVESTIQLREKKVQADIAEAKLINDQAKALMAEYEGRLSKARQQAQEVYQQVAEENNRKAADNLSSQQKALEAKLTEAEARIHSAKAQTLATLDKEAESIVAELVARVAGITPKADAVASAIAKVKGA